MTIDNNAEHSFVFVDEKEYKELQQDHPPDTLAQVNSVIDPDTGDFNWDCPCLGGMANPPCGSFFKEAFTCFTFSTEEPKGIDCVDKFRDMQHCFRQFPEIYADELKDDKDKTAELLETQTPDDEEALMGSSVETEVATTVDTSFPAVPSSNEGVPETEPRS